jgi:tRNA-dihydrouridine synthase 3
MERSGVRSIMLARGALVKPWLFREIREGREWLPTAEERFSVLWRFVELLREHFRDDEKGRRRILKFLPWHLDFFCRYRPLPEALFGASSREHPLIQTRVSPSPDPTPLEALLRESRKDLHVLIAQELVASASEEEALVRALRVVAEAPSASDEGGELTVAADQVSG